MKTKYKNIFVEGAILPEMVANSIATHSSKTKIGGHSIFLGQVRADKIESDIVQAIEFSAHIEMALEIAHRIREDIFKKYPLECMHVYHSLGTIKVGEICFFVFTSSKHRKVAMDACAEVTERIKKEIPIWGKEITENNYQWKVNS